MRTLIFGMSILFAVSAAAETTFEADPIYTTVYLGQVKSSAPGEWLGFKNSEVAGAAHEFEARALAEVRKGNICLRNLNIALERVKADPRVIDLCEKYTTATKENALQNFSCEFGVSVDDYKGLAGEFVVMSELKRATGKSSVTKFANSPTFHMGNDWRSALAAGKCTVSADEVVKFLKSAVEPVYKAYTDKLDAESKESSLVTCNKSYEHERKSIQEQRALVSEYVPREWLNESDRNLIQDAGSVKARVFRELDGCGKDLNKVADMNSNLRRIYWSASFGEKSAPSSAHSAGASPAAER